MLFPSFIVDYQNQERQVHLAQTIALLLAKVKQNAESFLQNQVRQCNITVPTCYTPQQRLVMQDAGKIAGFEKVHIINDTTAAALVYALEKKNIERGHNILIFDVGATSTKASIVHVDGSSITIQACHGKMNLGGNNFTMSLLKHFTEDFKEKTGVDLSGKYYELSSLRVGCEDLKKRLASVDKAKVTLELFHNGEPYDLQLTRTEFESICQDVFMGIMEVMKEVFGQTIIQTSDIEKIILVGGGTRLPKIQQDLVTFMQEKELSRILNQDEANATGAIYLSVMNIKEKKGFENISCLKSELDTMEMRQFLNELHENEKSFIEYKSELVNLEGLCYKYKRELKKRDIDDVDKNRILNKCNMVLKWIKDTNYKNPTTIETVNLQVNELNKINTDVKSQQEQMDISDDEQTTRDIPLNEVVVQVLTEETETKTDSKVLLVAQNNVGEINKNQKPPPPHKVTTPTKEFEKGQNILQKSYQQGVHFFRKQKYAEAVKIFTEILDSKDTKGIKIESCFEMRGVCYYKLKQFQSCLNDLNKIPRIDRFQDTYNVSEHSLYRENTEKALEESENKFKKGDTYSQSEAMSLITAVLENKPQNQSVCNIRYTSQLLHRKALYNFFIGNYHDAISDVYQNMKMIHVISELGTQKHQMYKEVFEKLTTKHKAIEEVIKNNDMQDQLSFIKECLEQKGLVLKRSIWQRCVSIFK